MRKRSTGLGDASADLIRDLTECEKCGAVIGVTEDTCLHCFLGEGLESEGEASWETFQSVLTEADVPDKHWRLGHYEILEEIGRGGMGVIYRARQQHTRRIVALKRIISYQANSNETMVRFRREAEAVAALDHPNIIPIYEVSESEDGLPFFSMKYATGGSLRAAAADLCSTPRESVQLMAKVARAIAYAHDQGILHRDLQPGNILLDGSGDPLVSDFGLAKLLDASSDLTRTLTSFGTPGYIAPEQAESAAGDLAPTADVYSLGAILCYLLAGRPPFVGANVLSVIHQAAATPAPKLRALVPSLDRDLETIVARCLEREPQARYQSAAALAEDLERWLEGRPILARRVLPPERIWHWARRNPVLAVAATTCLLLAVAVIWLLGGHAPPVAISEKSIAVLPFENLSRDPENAYLADGIQDEILTRLSKISDLKVISRTSTETYKNAPRNLRQIAQQLGVSNILEGRIQKSADQIRVTVQLINAVTDSHLWAESYDRKFSDIFQVENDVAQKIAASLEAKLTGREKRDISSIGTQNPQAYEAYLRGLTAGRPFDYDSWQRAVQAFEDAVRADPQFAKAWASLGWLQARIYFQAFDQTEATRVAVGKAVQTAMRLDPELAEAQMASGFYEYYVVGDYDTARRMFEQVRSRWPNNADVVATLGLIAFRQGRWTEGREYLDEAIALSPRDSFLREEAASTRASARDFPAALQTINQALAIWPDSTNLIAIKATVYQALGELDQADALLSGLRPGAEDLAALGAICYQAMLRRDPAPAITLLRTLNDSSHSLPPLLQARYHVLLGRLVQLSGNTNETDASFTQARQILEKELQPQPQNPLLASLLAQTLAGVGDRDAALREADRAVELLPSSRDARDGPHHEAMRARIQARFGDGDRAIPTLKHLLQTPYSAWPGSLLTPALLRLDPDFDQLRSDPRFQELVASPAPEAIAPEKSIAILPFENLSDEKENAFFADGMHDDILTSLSKVRDLKVISRSSVMKYRGAGRARNLRDIGRALGAKNILEGSVRRAGNRVLVNMQLIDADSDRHIWAERYDRLVADSIGLQGELATEIATALEAKLAPDEKARLGTRPTSNPEAYLLYLRALDFEQNSDGFTPEYFLTLNQLYAQTIALDPTFALAHARASITYSNEFWQTHDPAVKAKARAAADGALRLSPTLGEAHLALGLCFYLTEGDFAAALEEFTIALTALPNNVEVLQGLARIYRKQGRWREAIAGFTQIGRLNPLVEPFDLVFTCWMVRDWRAAAAGMQRNLAQISDASSDASYARVGLAQIEVVANGDLATARAKLREIPAGVDPDGVVTLANWNLSMLERDWATAEKWLAGFPSEEFPNAYPKSFYQGQIARARGDTELAHRLFEKARPSLEGFVRDASGNPRDHAGLGILYGYMGRKDDAIREISQAIELVPENTNAFGVEFKCNLALVYALTGEVDQALTLLERLLRTPGATMRLSFNDGGITQAELRFRWQWDSLRADPRFQKLVEGPEPKTVY